METVELSKKNIFYLRALEWNEITFIIFVVSLIILLLTVYFWDRNQKKHTVLRNFPILGHIRYFSEFLGVFFSSVFFR